MQSNPNPLSWIPSIGERKLAHWLETSAWFLGSFAVLLALRSLTIRALYHRCENGRAYLRVTLDTVRVPSFFWCLAGAIAIGIRFADLNARQDRLALNWLVVLLIVSFTIAAGNIAVRILALYTERQGLQSGFSGLSKTIVHVVVLSMGALILLNYLGITITPILTALGVGGLAVALALQDTLGNFFAGIHILIEEPVRVGDFIQLSTGEEGTITDIGWRTTRVLTGANNLIVIPNNKITTSILTNFTLPVRWLMTPIDIYTAHTADVDLVKRLALETVPEAKGILPSPDPVFLFDPGPLPTHLHFKLIVPIAQRVDQGLARDSVRTILMRKFQENNVPMPMGDRLIGWP